MSEPTHDPDLTAVERALAAMAPSAGAFDRDALMFAAGQRSARRGWGWPCAAGGSTLAALALGALLLFRPAPQPAERVVFVPGPPQRVEITPTPADAPAAPDVAAPAVPVSPPAQPNYLTLRQQVERWGDAGLPGVPPSAADEKPAAPDDLLDLPPDLRADPWLQRSKAMLTPGGSL
ncbi:MAG TPA: hypothetical protein VKA46_40505 [Gemmataceae bacterium]|nr:hypothetical protein [Gemmataceae bacterium]